MARRVFIKVIGFTDEERHALNTVFRLSERCRTMYQLWTPQAPEPLAMALLDADSHEARLEAESPRNADLTMLWVGPAPPPQVWRSFERPISWTEIVTAMDAAFADDPSHVAPASAPSSPAVPSRQALIVCADRDTRLYLRARLSLARVPLADEADSGAQAVDLAAGKPYDVALVVDGLPDLDAWTLLQRLRAGGRAVARVAVFSRQRSMAEHMRAWFGGADALLDVPPEPAQLGAWLRRL